MPLIDATPKGVNANSYATLLRANEIMRTRPFQTEWVNASGPTAEGYLVNGTPAAGETTITIDGGSGSWDVGTEFTIDGDATIYKTTTAVSAPGGDLVIDAPGLIAEPLNNAAVTRLTGNERESGLIYATRLFDRMLVYKGYPTTTTQARRLPRYGLVDADGNSLSEDEIPIIIEEGVTEMALVVIRSDIFRRPAILGQGLKKAKVGPLNVEIDAKTGEEPAIPDNILALISEIATLEREAQKGSMIVPLVRV